MVQREFSPISAATSGTVKASIIIVSWNVQKDLVECLTSVSKNHPSDPYEVIVVDNASSDCTAECISRAFPAVTLIANEENRGFAAANNQAFEKARGHYILFLNPDTIVRAGSLDTLIRFMDSNPDVAACGPKLLNADGTTQPSVRRFPTFRAALYRHSVFRLTGIFRAQYKRWLMKDFDHCRQADVEQLMGAALMVRRSVIEQVGVMDERFFMYFEEVDLCYRIKQAGWRVAFIPDAEITHLGGRSAREVAGGNRIMMLTSTLAFFRKHRGRFETAVFTLVFKPAVILRDVCHIVSGLMGYVYGFVTLDARRREKSLLKIRNAARFLAIYSYRFLFKM